MRKTALFIITALVAGLITLSAGSASAARVTRCDSTDYGRSIHIEVCGQVRYRYIYGTCDPVKFDVRSVRTWVREGAQYLNYSALDNWTFEVTRGTGRNVVFARYNRTVLKDGDGSVDQGWRSVSRQPQGQGHLSMGGNVDVAYRGDWTASINVDIPRRSGCLA